MSEEDGEHFCVRNATPKHREIWRNIAIMAWFMGMVSGMVAVVILTGTSTLFAVFVVLNIIFIIVNCGFCCVHLQTLKKKRYFYITCLLLTVAITAVIVVTVVTTPENEFQIAGFVGCGLTFFSCVAFLILNILLHIRGPEDPRSSESNATPEECDDISSGILTIRYVSTLRGRIQEESFFRVQGGQILSHSQPDQVTNITQSAPSTQRIRRPSVFGFRTRAESEPERERRQSIERLPVQIISDDVNSPQRRDSAFSQTSCNSQRRDSAFSQTSFNSHGRDSAFSQTSFNSQGRDSSITLMSVHRRTSPCSIEYDTASVRCTCYYLPNETDSDDVPPYSETPTGNMTFCPLHGENPIPTPAYDDNTSTHSSLYRILGLPEYDEVVITTPVILPSTLKDATGSSPSDNLPTSTPKTTARRPMDSPHRTGPLPLPDRFSNVHNQIIFETIFEDRAERSDSFISQNTSQESDAASTSVTVTTTEEASTSVTVTTGEASTSVTVTTTDAASTSATVTIPEAASYSATVTTTDAASTSATVTTTEEASTSATVTTTDAASTSATVTIPDAASTSATVTTTDAASTSATVTTTDAASTSATVTTTDAAAADEPSVVITTTAADFTDQTTFSTSKQTA